MEINRKEIKNEIVGLRYGREIYEKWYKRFKLKWCDK